jgi:hypothetical protein
MNLDMRAPNPPPLFIAQRNGGHNHGSVAAPDQGAR